MAVDQLLFGYRDGHELIAGSRPLSAVQQRELLPHVDASFEAADERQLVGAAIPSLDGYLLARIWPAPERPRRGAVWAHALLLSAEQLRFRRLGGLLALLHRPVDERLDGYDAKLPWPRETEVTSGAPPPLVDALASVAYAGDRRPRVVLWHAARDAEPALVALLDAFPGPARSAFSFRTRERARLGATPYRLQVASVLSGQGAGASDVVIDARHPPGASTRLAS
jgi:GTPase-associated protein 1, N-terminal domain type 1